jgi:hypothetical protein
MCHYTTIKTPRAESLCHIADLVIVALALTVSHTLHRRGAGYEGRAVTRARATRPQRGEEACARSGVGRQRRHGRVCKVAARRRPPLA